MGTIQEGFLLCHYCCSQSLIPELNSELKTTYDDQNTKRRAFLLKHNMISSSNYSTNKNSYIESHCLGLQAILQECFYTICSEMAFNISDLAIMSSITRRMWLAAVLFSDVLDIKKITIFCRNNGTNFKLRKNSYNFSTLLNRMLPTTTVLAVLYLSLKYLKYPVLPKDIVTWAMNRTNYFQTLTKYSDFGKHSIHILSLRLIISTDFCYPLDSSEALYLRFVEELSLPYQLLLDVLSMHSLINFPNELQISTDKFQNSAFWISLLLATQKIIIKKKILRLKLSKWIKNHQTISETSLNYKSLQNIEEYLSRFNDKGSALSNIIKFEYKISDVRQKVFISYKNTVKLISPILISSSSRWIMEAEKNVLTTGLAPKTVYDIT